MAAVYSYEIEGVPLRTGDVICTTNGSDVVLAGQFWWLVGLMIPGDIDHIAVYIGPEGRCVEAGPKGVASFELLNGSWDADELLMSRGLVDRFVGVAYPLAEAGLPPDREEPVRSGVASYCLDKVGRCPYNLNFLDPDTEGAFYCSQLAYKAYRRFDINLNTGKTVEGIPGTDRIVFPQEIWDGCRHTAAERDN